MAHARDNNEPGGAQEDDNQPSERLDKVSHLPPIQSGPEKFSLGYSKEKKQKHPPQKVGTLKKAWRKGLPDCGVAGGLKSRRLCGTKSRPWQWLHALHLTSQGSTDNNSVATVFFSKYLGRKFLHPTSRKKRKLRENGDVQIYANLSKNRGFHKGTLSQTVSCDLVWHEPN